MDQDILSFLSSQSNYDWIKLNNFLKQNYGDIRRNDIRTCLVYLVQQGKIEIQDNAHIQMCSMIKPINEHENVQATLDNWPLLAKIKEQGRQHLADAEFKWYQTEIAKRQFEDYSHLKQLSEDSLELSKKSLKNSTIANIIAITAIVITILLWILKSKSIS